MELASGEYISFLMDDDLYHPQRLERMVPYLMADDGIKLVTSHRQGIDGNSNLLPLGDVTIKITQQDAVCDKETMAKLIFANNFNLVNFNFIGEPTTAMFRKKDLIEPFGTFAGRRYGSNVDLAAWFVLMNQGKGFYIADTLSFFRIHQGQRIHSFDLNIKNVNVSCSLSRCTASI